VIRQLCPPGKSHPIRVRIFGVNWNYDRVEFAGYGRTNIVGPPLQGFDSNFLCDGPFLHNAQEGEFYQARCKKYDQRLEILTQRVGGDKIQKCELKVTIKDWPYVLRAPALEPTPHLASLASISFAKMTSAVAKLNADYAKGMVTGASVI
jgi:hypothetical protein